MNRDNPDEIVYITKTGKYYHKERCGHLRRCKIPIKLSEALRGDINNAHIIVKVMRGHALLHR